jgi:hypothetical protein
VIELRERADEPGVEQEVVVVDAARRLLDGGLVLAGVGVLLLPEIAASIEFEAVVLRVAQQLGAGLQNEGSELPLVPAAITLTAPSHGGRSGTAMPTRSCRVVLSSMYSSPQLGQTLAGTPLTTRVMFPRSSVTVTRPVWGSAFLQR